MLLHQAVLALLWHCKHLGIRQKDSLLQLPVGVSDSSKPINVAHLWHPTGMLEAPGRRCSAVAVQARNCTHQQTTMRDVVHKASSCLQACGCSGHSTSEVLLSTSSVQHPQTLCRLSSTCIVWHSMGSSPPQAVTEHDVKKNITQSMRIQPAACIRCTSGSLHLNCISTPHCIRCELPKH